MSKPKPAKTPPERPSKMVVEQLPPEHSLSTAEIVAQLKAIDAESPPACHVCGTSHATDACPTCGTALVA